MINMNLKNRSFLMSISLISGMNIAINIRDSVDSVLNIRCRSTPFEYDIIDMNMSHKNTASTALFIGLSNILLIGFFWIRKVFNKQRIIIKIRKSTAEMLTDPSCIIFKKVSFCETGLINLKAGNAAKR